MAGLLSRLTGKAEPTAPAEDARAPLPRDLQALVEAATFSVREPITGPDGEVRPRVILMAAHPVGTFQMPATTDELVATLERRVLGRSPLTVAKLAGILEQLAAFALKTTATPSEVAAGQPLRRRRDRWIDRHMREA